MQKNWSAKEKITVFINGDEKSFISVVDENYVSGGGICLVAKEEHVNLISSAPIILAALEGLVKYQLTGENPSSMKKAIDAISKATGQQ